MAVTPDKTFIPESGMTRSHFEGVQQTAHEKQQIIVMRNTNTASTRLIEMGCPAKPLEIKFHVSSSTGVVTAAGPSEIKTAYDAGYYVVGADGVARREFFDKFNGRQVKQELKLQNVFWNLQPGQLIDPKLKKPLVGDYDLMGVIDPQSRGRNVVLVAKDGVRVADVMSPMVREVKDTANKKFDQPRVMHGAHDQFAAFRGGATVFFPKRFFPNRPPLLLPDEFAVKLFYESIHRQTILGAYARAHLQPGGPGLRVVPGRSFVNRARAGFKGAARDANAMAILGQSIGVAIQWLGDFAVRRRIEQELQTTHAAAIAEILLREEGVLVVIRMQEWAQADFNGMRARGLLGICLQRGATQQAALKAWQRPKVLDAPPVGWRVFEQYLWIDPTL